MVVFNCLYSWIWYRLQKNNEVMVEVVVCLITWCQISCMRLKKDFNYLEENYEVIVKQIWYKNPHRDLMY